MVKRVKKRKKTQTETQELVVVTFAEDMEQAKDYEVLLKSNDIPTMIKEQNSDDADNRCIAIMVPEDCLDEAHVIIESQSAYDDFYDFAIEDEYENDDDFEDGFFEDDI